MCSFNVTILFSWWSDSSGEYFAGLKIWWFKCLGIYGLIWCAQLLIFLAPPLIYDALAENILLHLAPLVIYKQNISRAGHAGWWPHNRYWNGYEFSLKHWMYHWMAWKHGQFILLLNFAQHLLSVIISQFWDYFSRLVLL